MDIDDKEIIESKEEFINSSNPWFIISVVVTLVVILLLVGNLFYSYYAMNNFDSKELTLQKNSGKLMSHIHNLKLITLISAHTGDLTWEKNYIKNKKIVNNNLEKISDLVAYKESFKMIDNIKENKKIILKIEDQAYQLISQGQKKEAVNLLKSWNYIKNHKELIESTKNLTNFVNNHVQKNIAFRKKIIFITFITVIVLFGVLIFSWYISIKTWRYNIKKRREKEEKIIYLNFHDSLTDLYNRRYFMQAGKEELERADRYEESLSFMMIDIDHFKNVNDTYGHVAGDNVLKKLAKIIEESVRDVDIVGRLGGEEFGIILPKTPISVAKQVGDRLRKNIKNNTFKFEKESISVTVSVGIAKFNQHNMNMDNILHKADVALYEAKNRGRNCVITYKNTQEK